MDTREQNYEKHMKSLRTNGKKRNWIDLKKIEYLIPVRFSRMVQEDQHNRPKLFWDKGLAVVVANM